MKTRTSLIGALGIAGCAGLMAMAAQAGESGYTSPGAPVETGRAPGLQYKLLSTDSGGQKTYVLAFAKGDEVMSGLNDFARHEHLKASHLSAIGSFSQATFGWFDRAKRSYRHIPIRQQVEVLTLTGDIGVTHDGKPQVHVHGIVGFADGSTKGGHLLDATVWPTLELFITESPTPIFKSHDDETNLNLMKLK